MKFIHTSDWHLGNKMHDVDRTGETEFFFKWLKDTIVKEECDALIVSGDIFDTVNPPVEAKRQYIQFLSSLLGTSCKNVIITGGNHDSAALLDSEKSILEALNIYVTGTIANRECSDYVFVLNDKNGNACGICAAVPFVRESELRSFCEEETEGNYGDNAYKALYKAVLKSALQKDNGRNLPIIATGHFYAADLEGRFEGAGREEECDDGRRCTDVVGNLGSIHCNVIPEEFTYTALGHIHYTTMVAKNPKVRYSGSPFILGFDEASLKRYVLCVDTHCDEENRVKRIEVPQLYTFRRLTGDSKAIVNLLETYDTVQDKTVFLELYYKKEAGVNICDLVQKYIPSLESKNVFIISYKVQDAFNGHGIFTGDMSAEEIKNLDSEDIFKALILSKTGEDFSGLSEEDREKRSKELLSEYLPFFNELYKSFKESGENI